MRMFRWDHYLSPLPSTPTTTPPAPPPLPHPLTSQLWPPGVDETTLKSSIKIQYLSVLTLFGVVLLLFTTALGRSTNTLSRSIGVCLYFYWLWFFFFSVCIIIWTFVAGDPCFGGSRHRPLPFAYSAPPMQFGEWIKHLEPVRGCTSGGVYVPCIYTHARWELP